MKRIIIVGASGDLGSQLADISEQAGFETVRVEHELNEHRDDYRFSADDYIHLCIPALSLGEYAWLKNTSAQVILHDSVMSTSVEASRRYFAGQAATVHMLMNESKSVVVDDNSTGRDDTVAFLLDIGLKPTVLSVLEHDQIMAASQAPLALLSQVIHTPIKRYREMGLLTTSGEELERALDARSARWTPVTIQSLLQNPQLHQLVDDMKATLETMRYNKDNDQTDNPDRPSG